MQIAMVGIKNLYFIVNSPCSFAFQSRSSAVIAHASRTRPFDLTSPECPAKQWGIGLLKCPSQLTFSDLVLLSTLVMILIPHPISSLLSLTFDRSPAEM